MVEGFIEKKAVKKCPFDEERGEILVKRRGKWVGSQIYHAPKGLTYRLAVAPDGAKRLFDYFYKEVAPDGALMLVLENSPLPTII